MTSSKQGKHSMLSYISSSLGLNYFDSFSFSLQKYEQTEQMK